MPTPFDLLTRKIEPPDPNDLLRNQLGQNQGATLGGLGPPQMASQPMAAQGMPGQPQQAMQNMPPVAGPLAAIPQMAKAKPRVKLKTPPKKKPRIKLKVL